MKNLKLIVLTVSAVLFLGMGSVNAQEKKIESVLVSVFFNTTGSRYTIEVVKPDYSVEVNEYSVKENSALISLKKEFDKWLEQGYKIQESVSPEPKTGVILSSLYILVKENEFH